MTARGVLISVEGIDGAGKSTQVSALARALEAEGHEVVVARPDGTDLGRRLRGCLLDDRQGDPLAPWAEALLFNAGRVELLRQVVLPALARGAVVVADRFVDSTLAYQGGGRGVSADALRRLHADACADLWPDLTVLLELSPEAAGERQARQGLDRDRFEQAPPPFHAAVAAAFDRLAAEEPRRWIRVDAALPAAEVAERVRAAVTGWLDGLPTQARPALMSGRETRGSRRATP